MSDSPAALQRGSMDSFRFLFLSVSLAFGFFATAFSASAQSEPPLKIELNRLEPQGETCRAYLLVENGGGVTYKSLKLDLFVLDVGGVVAKRLGVELAPLAARKTSVKLFDFTGLPCSAFGRVLLNDVTACADESGAREDCLARLETASRSAAPFIK